MTNKATKYGFMIIAAVLLVAVAFAGAASAGAPTPTVVSTWDEFNSSINSTVGAYLSFTGGDSIAIPDGVTTLDCQNAVVTMSGSKPLFSRSGNMQITISNLTITGLLNPSYDYFGALFTNAGNITFRNIHVCDLQILTGNGPIGGLLGGTSEDSTVYFIDCDLLNCSIESSGGSQLGGFIGFNRANTTILNCTVNGCKIEGVGHIGGLIGKTSQGSAFVIKISGCGVTNCSFIGTSSASQGNNIAGLVGALQFIPLSENTITNCIVENCSISGKFANVGGLVGYTQSNNANILKLHLSACLVKNCNISVSHSATTRVGGLISSLAGNAEAYFGTGISTVSGTEICSVENCTLFADTPASTKYEGIAVGNLGGKILENSKISYGSITNLTDNTPFYILADPAGSGSSSLSNLTATHIGDGEYGYRHADNSIGYGVGKTAIYLGNGAISGTVPVDNNLYLVGDVFTPVIYTNLVKPGYHFSGNWYNVNDGSVVHQGSLSESLILYSMDEEKDPSKVILNLDSLGGTGAVASVDAYYLLNNTFADKGVVPVKAGYTFNGWNISSTDGTALMNNTGDLLKYVNDGVFWYTNSAGYWNYTGVDGSSLNLVANWTVNTTNVIASGNMAEFHKDNITAIHSGSDIVVKVLLEEVSNVTDTAVNFTADNTSVGEIPGIAGYSKDEITIFDLNATAYGTAKINVTVTFANDTIATSKKENVSFYHYNTTNNAWDATPLTFTMVQNDAEVLYTVETTSFSSFGIGIYTPITYTVHFDANGGQGSMDDMAFTYDVGQNLTANAFQRYNSNFLYWTYNGTKYYDTEFVKNLTVNQSEIVVMKAQWETYSTGGSSSGSTYMGSNSASYTPTVTPTVKPTVAPTAAATEKPATPTVIATEKPTTQATQSSPAPFLGILAGLGAAALVLGRLRK